MSGLPEQELLYAGKLDGKLTILLMIVERKNIKKTKENTVQHTDSQLEKVLGGRAALLHCMTPSNNPEIHHHDCHEYLLLLQLLLYNHKHLINPSLAPFHQWNTSQSERQLSPLTTTNHNHHRHRHY